MRGAQARHLSAATPPFEWGVATSAYQIEGGNDRGGRGPSIWDSWGPSPVNSYELWRADVQAMRELGVKNYRFSISWPRMFPMGAGAPNAEGVRFYSTFIDALLEAGITPWITLYHFDLPQALQDAYGGWASARIVPDYAAYAEAAFRQFGGRVKRWLTFNEPKNFCFLGYATAVMAPFLKDAGGADAWHCTLHVLQAHAEAVARFRRIVPGGKISMALDSMWALPRSSSAVDTEAAQRYLDFKLGIYADPLWFGAWPASVEQRIAALPPLPPALAARLNASQPDFFAINAYSSLYIYDQANATGGYGEGRVDFSESYHGGANNATLGALADSDWLYVHPDGMRRLLAYVSKRYSPAEVVVSENGVDDPGEAALGLPDALRDDFRTEFFRGYVQAAEDAVAQDAVPLRYYFVWSLLDNFEWQMRMTKRFGIVCVKTMPDVIACHLK
ncbi:hypothetical protein WJX81_005774 [Elliptochloris bilobata]|uniref:Beta-glucosidase n=1 Tax=Elliptochloris bilobata TaxID=381761 RepID=A0AAW1REY3_9CHLO